MDFTMVDLDSLVGSQSSFPSLVSDAETRENGYRSGFLNQGRSSGSSEEDWSLKIARTDDFSASKAMLLQQCNPSMLRSNSIFPDDQQQQQMLSFSSPKSDSFLLSQDSILPYYNQDLSTYTRSTGLGSESLNASLRGVLKRVREPFTPSQWVELEQQALIYKYLNANAPIPSNLLIPYRKLVNPSGSSGSAGSCRPNPLGWSSFHLAFATNTDPEPGRCRRTDGKKWRCSRDAVVDQKYCERHLNRSRHRSRKPVEGQTGHAVSGTATKRMMPMGSTSASVAPSGGASSSHAITQHQVKSLQPGATDPSANSLVNRILLNKENVGGGLQDSQGLSLPTPTMNAKSKDNQFSVLKQHNPFEQTSTMNLKSKDTQFSVLKQHNPFEQSSTMNLKSRDTQFSVPKQHNPFEDSSRINFALFSDSFLNSPHRSSYIDGRNSGSNLSLYDPEPEAEDPVLHFIDDWPKNPSDNSPIAWPEVEETNLDQTKLSISIPVASSEFSSSPSSPTHEKLSPLRMGLTVGSTMNEPTLKQANWIPISWETSTGGPLGEVLNNANNTAGDFTNSSALNLKTEGWNTSPQMELSPTEVLQKTSFGSLSNGSRGSSPGAEIDKTHAEAKLCGDLPGSTHVMPSSIPYKLLS